MKDECSNSAPLISRYLDGECTPEEAEKVESHLETCSACMELKKELESVISLTASAFPREESRDVNWDAMWNNIEKEAFPGPSIWQKIAEAFRQPVIWFPAAAISAAVAALLFLNIYPQATQQTVTPLCHVESVSTGSGQVMILKTARTGQPIIWIMPVSRKDGHS